MASKIPLMEFAQKLFIHLGSLFSLQVDIDENVGDFLFDHTPEERKKISEDWESVCAQILKFIQEGGKIFFKLPYEKNNYVSVNPRSYLPDILAIQSCLKQHLNNAYTIEDGVKGELYIEADEAKYFLDKKTKPQKLTKDAYCEVTAAYFGGLTRTLKLMINLGEKVSIEELRKFNGLDKKEFLRDIQEIVNFANEGFSEEEGFELITNLFIDDYRANRGRKKSELPAA